MNSKKICLPFTAFSSLRPAFTLAEVLITLGIIGIVAALTMPNLVKNYQIKELEGRYKKGYSVIMRITNDLKITKGFTRWEVEYCYQNNPSCKTGEYTGMNTVTKLKTDLAPYFSGANFIQPKGRSIRSITGVPATGDFATWYNNYAETFYLADGMIIKILAMSNAYITLAIDTNGTKNPNQMGFDVFMWKLTGPKLIPGVQLQADSCSLTSGIGTNCSLYATINDCPWDNSKRYWDVGCLP